jgi:hypothetical protein
MRLPHFLLENLCFTFSTGEDLLRALGGSIEPAEAESIKQLVAKGLPPITSARALAAMVGVNEGLIWSMVNRQARHYRIFQIPKGQGRRSITAPRVALKTIQKWLSVRLQAIYQRPDHVFGFIPGLSHIDAATRHLNASWVLSIDIENFFPSTPELLVHDSLLKIGYPDMGATLIARLACFQKHLAQGAPTSPVLSNIAFLPTDTRLNALAMNHQLRFTRYADDIVLSGTGQFPASLTDDVCSLFLQTPWRIAEQKTHLAVLPSRLKVHGLLVHGDKIRLTKGYRNKLRAFKHLHDKGAIHPDHLARIRGHLSYASAVDRR